ncbi:spermatogenesis-associated protein 31E1-like [Hippopotamus amphibius kiboko]|uniref:spermatogenesis-associated protein 31E1-like n=1 Tax=Hippopotamus amphibius kiboko TaxID=575201 RepID=UPI002592C02D|nr:spermatogenesis-associated protein 31E1-like [Hippopotamus amphibius kiboko]
MPGLPSPPGPGGSWLQLVPRVSCSHLGRLPDKGGFHRISCQDPTGEMCKAEPAGAHQPCGEPAEEAIPTMCHSAALAPLTQGPLPLTSTLSTEPQDQSNLKRIPLGTVAKSSPPGNSLTASTIPGILSLGLASYTISFLSCWWQTTKALFFPTTSQSESQQEHLSHHPPEAPFWGGPTDKQIETGNPSFVSPDVQKLLEILIMKRVELKICKANEKDGSFSEQMSSDYHLNSLGNMWKSLDAEQDTITPQSFWDMKDKPEQLPSPQHLLHPKILRDHLEQKYSQLFWGLPSLHSESLVATTFVSRSSSQQQAPFVLFNGISNGFPVSIQPRTLLGLSQAPLLPCPGAQPQSFTQNVPQYQPPPPAQIQAQPYLPSPLLFGPPYSPPQMNTCGLYCPTFQNEPSYFTPTETQHLEHLLLKKQLKSGTPLPSVVKRSQEGFSQLRPNLPQDRGGSQAQMSVSIHHGDLISPDLQKQHLQKRLVKDQPKRGLPCNIHLSLELSSSQCQYVGTYQAQGKQGPWQPSDFTGKRSLDSQKIRSRCLRRSHRKSQMEFQPSKDVSRGLRPCLRRISKDPSRASFPVKFLQMNSEKELERYLMRPSKSDSGNGLPSVPDKKHLEKILKAHLSKKLRQVNQGFIPVTVRRSWLAANHAFSKSHPHEEIRNLASLKCWKPWVNTSRELSFLSRSIQQMLEAHIIRFRVKHRWDLANQAFEPMNLKPCEPQPSPLPKSTFSPSATRKSGAHSKANFAKFLGKLQPHQVMKVVTKASVPTPVSPLPAPSPAHTEIQRTLGRTSPSDRYGPSEAPLTTQEGRLPYQMPTLNLMGRTWETGTVLEAKKSSLKPSLSSAMTSNKPREKSWGWVSQDPHHNTLILGMDLKSQSSRAKPEAEEDPAWEVILGPSVLANSQTTDMDLRRSGFPATRKSLSPPTKLVAQHPKEPCFKTQVTSKFKFGDKVESKDQPQDEFLQDSHTGILLQDYATGNILQYSATNVLLQDSHTDVLLAADILARHRSLSSSQGDHASEDTWDSQVVPYDLNMSEQSSQGQRECRKPKLKDPFKSQNDTFAPTETWRGFKRPQPGEHGETKSQSKVLAPAGDWKSARKLQPGEDEETRSNQGQQTPRKPKVRDPRKGQFASADEGEVCESLEPEEDEEMNSQSEMFAPSDERKDDWRPKPGEHGEGFSGLRASRASGMRRPPRVRKRGGSLRSKYLQLSPGNGQLLPGSYFRKRMRQFLQCLSPNKKIKGMEESLQKAKPASATAQCREPVKANFIVDSGDIDPQAIGKAVGQVLIEILGLHQGIRASELNQHAEELLAPAGGHSHYHRVLSSSEQRRVSKDTTYSNHATPKDHSYLNTSRHTRDRGNKWAFPTKEPESPVRPRQHGPRLAGDSSHLHHRPTCCPQKCAPSGQ